MNDRLYPVASPAIPRQRKRALPFLVALCTAACVIQACAEPSTRGTDRGAMRRVVSLVPSATEMLVALGAADRVVGRTDYDADPRLAHVFSFGRSMRASTEAILTLAPDLVIEASYAPSTLPAAILEQHRIATLTTHLQTYADILALVDTLGSLLGETQRAASLRNELQRGAEELGRTAPRRRPSALYLVWAEPPRTISSRSYLADVIELAGARNAFADLTAEWPEISLEVILQRDPDYVILATETGTSADRFREHPAWKELSALRSGRVIEVPADLFHRPGPRVIDAARWLRNALHATAGVP